LFTGQTASLGAAEADAHPTGHGVAFAYPREDKVTVVPALEMPGGHVEGPAPVPQRLVPVNAAQHVQDLGFSLGRANGRRRCKLEAANQPKVPRPQPGDGCELLPGEIVAEDAVQPGCAVFLCEAVFLPGPAEVLGHDFGSRERFCGHIGNEHLILPAIDQAAVLRLSSTRIAADHHPHIDRLVGGAVILDGVCPRRQRHDAEVERRTPRAGERVRHELPRAFL
jgi:hypothetical protein